MSERNGRVCKNVVDPYGHTYKTIGICIPEASFFIRIVHRFRKCMVNITVRSFIEISAQYYLIVRPLYKLADQLGMITPRNQCRPYTLVLV